MTADTNPELTAAQEVLAAEHAAIYAYGVCGGVLDAGTAAAVRTLDGFTAHQTRRERLESLLRGRGVEPVAPSSGYALPGQVTDAASAARLARQVEDRCAVAYAALVGVATGSTRRAAVGWLTDAATRGVGWGAAPSAFPGLQDR